MNLNNFHKLVEEKGGTLLPNRTVVDGVPIGTTFSITGLTGIFEVLFFYRDKNFKNLLLACCGKIREETPLFVSTGIIKMYRKDIVHTKPEQIQVKEEVVIRHRRIQQIEQKQNKGLFY